MLVIKAGVVLGVVMGVAWRTTWRFLDFPTDEIAARPRSPARGACVLSTFSFL
jgi:hypothetical protein